MPGEKTLLYHTLSYQTWKNSPCLLVPKNKFSCITCVVSSNKLILLPWFSRLLLLSLSWRQSDRRVVIRKGKSLKSHNHLRHSFSSRYILNRLQFELCFILSAKIQQTLLASQNNIIGKSSFRLCHTILYIWSLKGLYIKLTCKLLTSVNMTPENH